MQLNIILFLFCFHVNLVAQEPTWYIYVKRSGEAFVVKTDSLQFLKHVELNKDSLYHYINFTIKWPRGKSALWMGAWLASFKDLNGRIHKIYISMYGGFYYDEFDMTYYELPTELRGDWVRFVKNAYNELMQ